MQLTWQSPVTLVGVITAVITLFGLYNKVYSWVKNQQKQDAEIAEIKKEQRILTTGTLACLKGLKELGCNGPVTEAVHTMEDFLNEQAHK